MSEAESHFAVTAPRGEIVVVVDGLPDGAGASPAVSNDELKAAVEGLVSEGRSRRDAVRAVAAELGRRRSEVYEAAVGSAASLHTSPGD